ncbi:MAG TPA: hypothetical protein DCP03_16310 [Polaromonas sp.]|nr:hypothetical protein [Polaromonas sp.]
MVQVARDLCATGLGLERHGPLWSEVYFGSAAVAGIGLRPWVLAGGSIAVTDTAPPYLSFIGCAKQKELV